MKKIMNFGLLLIMVFLLVGCKQGSYCYDEHGKVLDDSPDAFYNKRKEKLRAKEEYAIVKYRDRFYVINDFGYVVPQGLYIGEYNDVPLFELRKKDGKTFCFFLSNYNKVNFSGVPRPSYHNVVNYRLSGAEKHIEPYDGPVDFYVEEE